MKNLKFKIQIKGSDRCFQLRCLNKNDFLNWQTKITHSIDKSSGKSKGMALNDYKDDVNQLFEFWRFLRLPEEKFLL